MSARRPRRAFDWSAAVIATLAITSAIIVFLRDGQTRFLAILTDDVSLFGTMLPKVLAGCLIGAFVTLLLPRETIARWVGAESGIGGIVVATVAGAILPGGPFTIYPIAGAFLAAGADAGAACAFVISWTVLGALTPGGPVVGFAIATAALKSGAGAPQIIAYTTAWALFAIPRVLVFEIPAMPPRVVWLRVAVSLPLPLLAAWAAMVVGRP